MNRLAVYESLLKLSAEMAEEAKRQNWEALGHLQAQRSSLLAGQPSVLPTTPAGQADAIRNIIQQIQAHDASVMKYVTPWREQVGQLISKLPPAA